VLEGVRALFRRVSQKLQPVDLNELTRDVLQSLRGELKDHGVATYTELSPKLPFVAGQSQLQQVTFNLVRNALEAMDTTTDRSRVLKLRTECSGRDAVIVAVEDSGPGIDPKQLGHIFDKFVTTKPDGMRLGLPICRMTYFTVRADAEIPAAAINVRFRG
jgi:C4-dicarboxylate-specific signal transduction histidine kinase